MYANIQGVLAVLFRQAAKDTTSCRKFILFDGPVDAVWIEDMNTVLDDNKKLCLMSGEIIKMSDTMTMMFETEDLEQASPATVSRLGIIYTESRYLGWEVLCHTWLDGLSDRFSHLVAENGSVLQDMFHWLLPPSLFFVEKFCNIPTRVTPMECCCSLIRLLESFMKDSYNSSVQSFQCLFITALTWSVGAAVDTEGRMKFSNFVHMIASQNKDEMRKSCEYDEFVIKNPNYRAQTHLVAVLPPKGLLYDYIYDFKTSGWVHWMETQVSTFVIPKDASFQSIFVPTIDTVRHEYLVRKLALCNHHVLVTGPTSTGKSAGMKKLLGTLPYKYFCLNFSAQTKASQTQVRPTHLS